MYHIILLTIESIMFLFSFLNGRKAHYLKLIKPFKDEGYCYLELDGSMFEPLDDNLIVSERVIKSNDVKSIFTINYAKLINKQWLKTNKILKHFNRHEISRTKSTANDNITIIINGVDVSNFKCLVIGNIINDQFDYRNLKVIKDITMTEYIKSYEDKYDKYYHYGVTIMSINIILLLIEALIF